MNEQRRAARIEAAISQLDRAAESYLESREELEAARVRFRAASDALANARRMADDLLSSRDLFAWRREHPEVQYAGMSASEAIEELLTGTNENAAWSHCEDEKRPYPAWFTLERIVEALEAGGFEFRSATPLREINAALINLKTVRKHEAAGAYTSADAEEILERTRALYDSLKEVVTEGE